MLNATWTTTYVQVDKFIPFLWQKTLNGLNYIQLNIINVKIYYYVSKRDGNSIRSVHDGVIKQPSDFCWFCSSIRMNYLPVIPICIANFKASPIKYNIVESVTCLCILLSVSWKVGSAGPWVGLSYFPKLEGR